MDKTFLRLLGDTEWVEEKEIINALEFAYGKVNVEYVGNWVVITYKGTSGNILENRYEVKDGTEY